MTKNSVQSHVPTMVYLRHSFPVPVEIRSSAAPIAQGFTLFQSLHFDATLRLFHSLRVYSIAGWVFQKFLVLVISELF